MSLSIRNTPYDNLLIMTHGKNNPALAIKKYNEAYRDIDKLVILFKLVVCGSFVVTLTSTVYAIALNVDSSSPQEAVRWLSIARLFLLLTVSMSTIKTHLENKSSNKLIELGKIFDSISLHLQKLTKQKKAYLTTKTKGLSQEEVYQELRLYEAGLATKSKQMTDFYKFESLALKIAASQTTFQPEPQWLYLTDRCLAYVRTGSCWQFSKESRYQNNQLPELDLTMEYMRKVVEENQINLVSRVTLIEILVQQHHFAHRRIIGFN